MNADQISALTDVIYLELFDANGAMLRERFGLRPFSEDDTGDDEVRDYMGIEAIQAIMVIEIAITAHLLTAPLASMTLFALASHARKVARELAYEPRKWAQEKGVELLTGKAAP